MTLPALKLAVVGHTNTGKTSLLRTLTRDVDFGEVSPHPATTRHVEGSAILLGGQKVMELYDTPGLEDSMGLLDHLDALDKDRRADQLEVVRKFLDGRKARGRFAQEAKAIRQVLASDLVLYVIDARDRVHGKHRDELEILSRCAVPVVPVLNFTAAPDANVSEWRDHLARVNMHAVAEFDTVVLDETSEQRLFEKMRTLLDSHEATLTALIEERRQTREALIRASAELTADMLLDAAACVVPVPVNDEQALARGIETLREKLRERERRCVEQLLGLHQFRPEDYEADGFPLAEGQWGLDLFNPETLRTFGVRAGGGAAAGALAGLTLDAMAGGTSLGAATAIGATVGGLLGAGRQHGRRLLDRVRGTTELRADDATLRLLAVRQILLIRALLRRGHAAMEPVKAPPPSRLEAARQSMAGLPRALRQARAAPGWSRLGDAHAAQAAGDAGRGAAKAELAKRLAEQAARPTDEPVTFP